MAKKDKPKKSSQPKPAAGKKAQTPGVTKAKPTGVSPTPPTAPATPVVLAAATPNPVHPAGPAAPDLVQGYLRRYGYLPRLGAAPAGGPAGAPALAAQPAPADEDVSRALRRFQALHGLQVTGEADAATEALIRLPRCGVPDVPAPGTPLAETTGKWPIMDLRYSILRIDSAPLPADQVRQAIEFALGLWSLVTPLNFQEDNNNPNLRISFEPEVHFDGPGDGPFGPNDLAHAFSPEDGRLHFNLAFAQKFVFSPADFAPDRFDLVSVAAHELGHTLGLGHSPSRDDIMFATYLAAHPFLAQGDLDEIRSLYGPR
jgi:hypothetical protein